MITQLRYRTAPKPRIRSTFKCQRRSQRITLNTELIPHISMENIFKMYSQTGLLLISSKTTASTTSRRISPVERAMRRYWNRIQSPGRHQRYRRKLYLARKKLVGKMAGYYKMQDIYNNVTAQV